MNDNVMFRKRLRSDEFRAIPAQTPRKHVMGYHAAMPAWVTINPHLSRAIRKLQECGWKVEMPPVGPIVCRHIDVLNKEGMSLPNAQQIQSWLDERRSA